MTKQTITYEGTHNGHKINTNKRKKQGCIKEIMNGYAIRLEAFTSKHVQTSVMQFTASAPASIPPDKTNKAIGDSIRAIKKTMGNNKIDFQAGWVKEIADGSDCTSFGLVQKRAKACVFRTLSINLSLNLPIFRKPF